MDYTLKFLVRGILGRPGTIKCNVFKLTKIIAAMNHSSITVPLLKKRGIQKRNTVHLKQNARSLPLTMNVANLRLRGKYKNSRLLSQVASTKSKSRSTM